jgi:hypothetical protein
MINNESDKILYIHVGGPKTGTTSIQTFVTQQREKLLSQYGLYYPSMGCSRLVERGPHKSIAHKYLIIAGDTVWKSLRTEVTAQKHSKVLISWEGILSQLADLTPQKRIELLDKIRTCFPGYHIKFVLYLRRFDDEFKSQMNQVFKMPIPRRRPLWNKWRPFKAMYGNIFPHIIEFYRTAPSEIGELFTHFPVITLSRIELAIRLFGKENFLIRLYDRTLLKDGNIVVDFFDALGIEFQGELLEAAEQRADNSKVPDETLPFFSKMWQIVDMGGQELAVAQAITSKIKDAFDPAQQGSLGGGGIGMEAEIAAIIDEFEALAPGYKNLFKDRPCSFSFPEIDLDPKELLKFDLLSSLYINDFWQTQAISELKQAISELKQGVSELKQGVPELKQAVTKIQKDLDKIVSEIKRSMFPNLMQRLVLLFYRPILKLSLLRELYAVFRKTPDDFLAATDLYPVKRLRKILRFFGPIPPTKRSEK